MDWPKAVMAGTGLRALLQSSHFPDSLSEWGHVPEEPRS